MVSFRATNDEMNLIYDIAVRAHKLLPQCAHHVLMMDITAAHANGNPLRLADLLAADDLNFLHDIGGIVRNLDRNTGKLQNCFVPRFSLPAP